LEDFGQHPRVHGPFGGTGEHPERSINRTDVDAAIAARNS
jgi:hypothetical protein